MYTRIADFEKTWKGESGHTRKILEALTDASLSQSVAEDHRTIGRIAWHITTTIGEMMSQHGLELSAVDPKAPVPATAAEILQAYDSSATELLNQVKASWDDAALETEDNLLYGELWKRGRTLDILIRHEVHHRGQMTVLMRQAGLTVPGAYGPSKEEWTNYGQPPPEI